MAFLFSRPVTINDLAGPVQLSWATDGSDPRPDFDVSPPVGLGAPLDLIANDVLEIQYQSAGGNWSSATNYLRHTITQSEMNGTTMSQTSVAAVPSGSYDFRARLNRNGIAGAWGTSVSVTIS